MKIAKTCQNHQSRCHDIWKQVWACLRLEAWAKSPRSLPGNVFLASSQENREGLRNSFVSNAVNRVSRRPDLGGLVAESAVAVVAPVSASFGSWIGHQKQITLDIHGRSWTFESGYWTSHDINLSTAVVIVSEALRQGSLFCKLFNTDCARSWDFRRTRWWQSACRMLSNKSKSKEEIKMIRNDSKTKCRELDELVWA